MNRSNELTDRPKILWAANTYWDSPHQVGANHLAQELERRGWDILFVSEPVSLMHLLKPGNRDGVYDCFRDWRRGVQRSTKSRVWYYSPFSPLWVPLNYPFLRSEFVLRNWQRWTIPNIIDVVRAQGFYEIDLLVLDLVSSGFWLDAVKAKKTVYRVTDNFAAFTRATPAMIQYEREIAGKVDLVIYTAESLENYVRELRPRRLAHVPNGVNVDHFIHSSADEPIEYRSVPHPRILYIGAMAFWFDWDLVNAAIEELHDHSFVFIGPDAIARKKLKQKKNVYILGRRAYADIPPYVKNADVGIIPFNVDAYPALVNSVNPIKLYDYMASGIPVVAVRWEELVKIKSPAVLTRGRAEFVDGIRLATRLKNNSKRFVEFAKRNDWSERANRFLQAIRTIDRTSQPEPRRSSTRLT